MADKLYDAHKKLIEGIHVIEEREISQNQNDDIEISIEDIDEMISNSNFPVKIVSKRDKYGVHKKHEE